MTRFTPHYPKVREDEERKKVENENQKRRKSKSREDDEKKKLENEKQKSAKLRKKKPL